MNIRIGIMGYGNLGRGIECAARQNPDMELKAVFTRRPPEEVRILTESAAVYRTWEAVKMKDQIDVLLLCGSSASDLPKQAPEYAQYFHVIDSYDVHAKINAHFEAVDLAAKRGGKIGIISTGWDPGFFSMNRLFAESILPDSSGYTFWGRGISQGHSTAIRGIKGVKDAKQYTVPAEDALKAVRAGETPVLSTEQKHIRECFVVLEDGADKTKVEAEIVHMPDYFADYHTIVHFITEAELKRDHGGLPHGGAVIYNGRTGWELENQSMIEYKLKLDSNPEFTGHVFLAYARAAYRLGLEGQSGAKTVFDIAPAYLSPLDRNEQRRRFL